MIRDEIAPGGKLRVGINHSNFLLVNPGSPHGAPQGIAPDLALELGRRLGVPVEFVSFDAAGSRHGRRRACRFDSDDGLRARLGDGDRSSRGCNAQGDDEELKSACKRDGHKEVDTATKRKWLRFR